MRTVLDTNTVVSALLFGGPPRQLLNLGDTGELELYTSDVMVAELAGVLARAKFAARLAAAVPPATPEALLLRYVALATIVVPAPIGRTVEADADDDMVIATALADRATLIVIGDADLLVMDPFSRDTHTRERGGVGQSSQDAERLRSSSPPASECR